MKTCSCEVKGKAREVEKEVGSNQRLGHERINLVQGANVFGVHMFCYSIFLKIPTLKL
jgi:hypothetical protein